MKSQKHNAEYLLNQTIHHGLSPSPLKSSPMQTWSKHQNQVEIVLLNPVETLLQKQVEAMTHKAKPTEQNISKLRTPLPFYNGIAFNPFCHASWSIRANNMLMISNLHKGINIPSSNDVQCNNLAWEIVLLWPATWMQQSCLAFLLSYQIEPVI